MSETVIKIENLSKEYRLGQVGTGTISHDLNRWWYKIRGKEDPYLKIGETNYRAHKGESDYVYALKDINLEVKKGEVLGIIGKNGAGKSTLLKILSKVTGPSTGSIKSKGRIASLLEVGTGFHPELTGRENIYMNGTIMGMTRKEIDSKFDEIIEFAGIERYIDTPTKRYSSGMTVRLGFAIAAHLEPEILVVDEVLAVGDAEFQKKAIGKMQEVSHEGGRTVLFVSHNMGAIKNLCDRCAVIRNGEIDYVGDTDNAIRYYLNDEVIDSDYSSLSNFIENIPNNNILNIEEVILTQNGQNILCGINNGQKLEISIKYQILQETKDVRLSVALLDRNNVLILRSTFDDRQDFPQTKSIGKYTSILTIPANFLSNEDYIFKIYPWVYLGENIHSNPIMIKVSSKRTGSVNKAFPGDPIRGLIAPLFEWETKACDE